MLKQRWLYGMEKVYDGFETEIYFDEIWDVVGNYDRCFYIVWKENNIVNIQEISETENPEEFEEFAREYNK